MTNVFAGIDIGTSNSKIIITNAEGIPVYSASRPHEILTPQEGHVEQDPDLIVRSVLEAMRDAGGQLRANERIRGASFSSAMHSVLLLDENDRPLTNAITWADTRSKDLAHRLKETEAGYAIYRKTGTPIHPMTPLCKLAWFNNEKPALLRKASRVLSLKEYVFLVLFGERVVDHSIASATGMFDIFDRAWHPEALEHTGVRHDQCAEAVSAFYTMSLLPEKADEGLGMYRDTVFYAGASDGCLANFGLNVMDTKHAALSIGTSGAIRVTCTTPATDAEQRLFTYILDDTYYVTGGSINNGGILIKWFVEKMLEDTPELLGGMIDQVGQIPPGSDGLLCIPYLLGERAPHWNSFDRGVYMGVTFQHGRAHFLRAMMEGVAMTLLQIVEAMEGLFGPIESVLATGGFLKSPPWVQIIADVLDKKIYTSGKGDASALGAARLARYQQGFRDGNEDEENGEVYAPRPEAVEVYRKRAPRFKALYKKLAPDFEELTS